MSAGNRREKIENILKEAEPIIDKTREDQKPASVGNITGNGNQVVIGNDNVVINGGHPTQKASPPRKAKSLRRMCLVALFASLLFCVEQIEPPETNAAGSEAVITAAKKPDVQAAELDDDANQLGAIQDQPGFHCYAGCSFVRQNRNIKPLTLSSPNKI